MVKRCAAPIPWWESMVRLACLRACVLACLGACVPACLCVHANRTHACMGASDAGGWAPKVCVLRICVCRCACSGYACSGNICMGASDAGKYVRGWVCVFGHIRARLMRACMHASTFLSPPQVWQTCYGGSSSEHPCETAPFRFPWGTGAGGSVLEGNKILSTRVLHPPCGARQPTSPSSSLPSRPPPTQPEPTPTWSHGMLPLQPCPLPPHHTPHDPPDVGARPQHTGHPSGALGLGIAMVWGAGRVPVS